MLSNHKKEPYSKPLSIHDEKHTTTTLDNSQLPTPPPSPALVPKKRRRGDTSKAADFISKVKTELTDPTNDIAKPPPKAKKESKDTANAPLKRGRKPITSAAFTPEQGAYLTHLRQSSSNAEEIWILFEKKFHSGKTAKALKNHWFAIKDLVLLSGEEDKLLMETIEEVMGDLAATIVEKFKAKCGKKVTKGYVQKKMKEGKVKGSRETKEEE